MSWLIFFVLQGTGTFGHLSVMYSTKSFDTQAACAAYGDSVALKPLDDRYVLTYTCSLGRVVSQVRQ